MSGSLHVIRHGPLLTDIPGQLRQLADDIESGDLGAVAGCVAVLDSPGLDVYYWGTGETGPNAHLLLHAGASKMMDAVMAGKVR